MDAEQMKATMDWAQLGVLAGYMVGWLPTIATALSAVWFLLRIIESAKSLGWIGTQAPPPPSPYEPLD